MSLHLKDCHIVLNIKSSFENLFVSAYSGFIIVGKVENLNFSEKSLIIAVNKLPQFLSEVENLITFLLSNKETSELNLSCFGNYSWNGQTENHVKTISYYQSDLLLFSFRIDELFSITNCFLKVVFYSFLFKDFEILFFESVVNDCLNGVSLKSLQTNKITLSKYITNFIADNKDELQDVISINTKTILINLFNYYIEELKAVISIAEVKNPTSESCC